MAGETSKAAAIRELREETGIVAEADEIQYFASEKIPPFFNDDYFLRRDICVKDIILQAGETSDAKWVTYEEFLKMADAGELAPFVMEYMAPVRDKFEAALKANCL